MRKKTEEAAAVELEKAIELTSEDLLWIELIKTLDKLEKGVEGDLSSLARAVRNMNRFRQRLPDTMWLRIVLTLIPNSYRKEFMDLLPLFIDDIPSKEIELISNLVSIDNEEAKKELSALNGDVFATILKVVKSKEELAKKEIEKRQKELEKERLEREKKKNKNKDSDKSADKDDTDKEKNTDKDDNAMDVDDDGDNEGNNTKEKKDDAISVSLMAFKIGKKRRKLYPETYVFLSLLCALELYDRKNYNASLKLITSLIEFSIERNRRTCDLLSSRLYQFYGLNLVRLNSLSFARSITKMYSFYETACLQQNQYSQCVLINLILQSYLNVNLYSLAHKFVLKADFWEAAESSQWARYSYYRGVMACIELQYSDALFDMQQAIRRAPQNGANAFKLLANEWLIVIQLLMGDIPDRNVFLGFDGALAPFLEITECVRSGNLERYTQCLDDNDPLFKKLGFAKVLLRLRHNVIKTGLRKMNSTYSSISLNDMAKKLSFNNDKTAYYIVCKAIRDGVIDASIDSGAKVCTSNEIENVYRTKEPYQNFANRIRFCLDIRNNAVKSLRYPHKDDDDEEENKNNEDKDKEVTQEDIAEMIQKHFQDDDDD